MLLKVKIKGDDIEVIDNSTGGDRAETIATMAESLIEKTMKEYGFSPVERSLTYQHLMLICMQRVLNMAAMSNENKAPKMLHHNVDETWKFARQCANEFRARSVN